MSQGTGSRRRTAQDQEAFRDKLVAIASGLFHKQGFDTVSVRRITSEAGCAPMTFYVYFKSKQALLRHIWNEILQDAAQTCAAAINTKDTPKEQLRTFCGATVTYWLEHPQSYQIIYLNADRLQDESDTHYADSAEAERAFLRLYELACAAIESGELVGSADAISKACFTVTLGLSHALITIPETNWSADDLIHTTLTALLGGFSAA